MGAPPNKTYDLFRVPAAYDEPLVPGEPAGNRFDPAVSLCVNCLRCRGCGADVEEILGTLALAQRADRHR